MRCKTLSALRLLPLRLCASLLRQALNPGFEDLGRTRVVARDEVQFFRSQYSPEGSRLRDFVFDLRRRVLSHDLAIFRSSFSVFISFLYSTCARKREKSRE